MDYSAMHDRAVSSLLGHRDFCNWLSSKNTINIPVEVRAIVKHGLKYGLGDYEPENLGISIISAVEEDFLSLKAENPVKFAMYRVRTAGEATRAIHGAKPAVTTTVSAAPWGQIPATPTDAVIEALDTAEKALNNAIKALQWSKSNLGANSN